MIYKKGLPGEDDGFEIPDDEVDDYDEEEGDDELLEDDEFDEDLEDEDDELGDEFDEETYDEDDDLDEVEEVEEEE